MNMISMMVLWLWFVGIVLTQTPEDDEVIADIAGYQHRFYSGFFDTGVITQRKSIHYVFFQSQNDSSRNHLMVWLSGGPGCSSLLALFHENGPFIFVPGSTNLTLNPYAWNKNANLLYLQLPAGVGFSKSDSNMNHTDQKTAEDALSALRLFFNRFPTYKKNDLYLSGHGYAANYITRLAYLITISNNNPFSIFDDKINLKGILLGNPCTQQNECHRPDSYINSANHYQFLYKRAYITKEFYDQFTGSCQLDYYSYDCNLKRITLDKQFNDTNSSAYNIYSKCYRTVNHTTKYNYINYGCEDEQGIMNYLNDDKVRQQWNIHSTDAWQPCNWNAITHYAQGNGSYWLYPFLLQNTTLRVWIYSGDMDSTVPTLGTKKWLSALRIQLNLPIEKVWRKWWVPSYKDQKQDQVAGFIWQLETITLVTVKAAGYRAALDQPQAMEELLNSFISNNPLKYHQ